MRARLAGFLIACALAAVADGEVLAVRGGTVHTLGQAGTLEGATVLIEDGVIQAVGVGIAIPPGARVIAAEGKVVTPGLLDSVSRIGLAEISLESATVDSASDDPHWTAAFSVADAFNPASSLVAINRIEGLTRAVLAPRARSGPLAGIAAAVDLVGGEPSPVAMFAVYGEAGAERAGGSRAVALARLREALQDARDFRAHRAAFERGERRSYALSRHDLAALEPVIDGRLPLAVEAHRASDLRALLRLARELEIGLVLVGATEAWKVAAELAEAGVPVVLDPLENLPSSFERLGSTLAAAARLHAAGVEIAFSTGTAHNGRNLKQSAGIAVAYGLPWEAGLRAMTSGPAGIWGLDAAYGSLEVGKAADVVVWDGDPLEVTTFADQVIIAGEMVPMSSRQTLLRDRYRDLDDPRLPAYRQP
ncbi:MAG: amidohydrolase family protein [Acidobacteriota bacterium]